MLHHTRPACRPPPPCSKEGKGRQAHSRHRGTLVSHLTAASLFLFLFLFVFVGSTRTPGRLPPYLAHVLPIHNFLHASSRHHSANNVAAGRVACHDGSAGACAYVDVAALHVVLLRCIASCCMRAGPRRMCSHSPHVQCIVCCMCKRVSVLGLSGHVAFSITSFHIT